MPTKLNLVHVHVKIKFSSAHQFQLHARRAIARRDTTEFSITDRSTVLFRIRLNLNLVQTVAVT
eukprot:SAG31_NODE_1359_length_8639_cov_3.889813_13_plen_64_part_00